MERGPIHIWILEQKKKIDINGKTARIKINLEFNVSVLVP